jgi:hypothetical protein
MTALTVRIVSGSGASGVPWSLGRQEVRDWGLASAACRARDDPADNRGAPYNQSRRMNRPVAIPRAALLDRRPECD